MNKIFTNTSPSFQFFFATFIVLVVFLLTLLIGVGLALPIFGLNYSELSSYLNFDNPENIPVIKYFQGLQTLALFILPAFAVAYIFSEKISEYLSLNKKTSLNSVALVSFTIIAALPAVNVLIQFNEAMVFPEFLKDIEFWMRTSEDEAKRITEILVSTETLTGLLVNLFVMAVLPAIGEELIFRGVFQKIFTQMTNNYHWGIIISAFIFSSIHLQFYGFLPRFLMGVYFGYLLVWSKSLWLPILAHFINNAMAVSLYFFYFNESVTINPDTYGTENYLAAVVSLLFVISLVYITKKIHSSKMEISEYQSNIP